MLVATLALAAPQAVADAAPPPVQPGGFTAVTPARILDTRAGLGAPAAKVGSASVLELQVTGRGGLPAGGVSAVALNLTVTQPTNVGYLTVYPTGQARPVASSVNFAAGQTVANAVVVKVGTGGRVSIYNSSGTSHLVADVSGWHATTGGVGDNFTSIAPTRIFDSRDSQPVGHAGTVSVPVAGGVTAVALNVTATEPTAGGYLTVYPSGTPRPLASSLNMAPGETRANFVAVKASGGTVDIYNASGTTHVVVDVMGYWSGDSRGRLVPLTPTRILDTRSDPWEGALGREHTKFVQLPGRSAAPAGRTAAVVLNVTATQPTAGGYLTVFPAGDDRPLASNLNFAPGQTVPNLVIVPVGVNEGLNIFNRSGDTHVILDVVGWFDFGVDRLPVDGLDMWGGEIAIDASSTYAYVSNTGKDQVEVLRLSDGALEQPIPVGDRPMGLDLSPDGTLLYVANRGGASISVVDVATRAERRRFAAPNTAETEGPYSIAVLTNGKAVLTTTTSTGNQDGRMYTVDLAREAATFRTDFRGTGLTAPRTVVRPSGDRRSASIVTGGVFPAAVFRYLTGTDTFTDGMRTASYTYNVAANHDGSVTLVDGGLFYDAQLRLTGTAAGCGFSVALDATGTTGYGLDRHPLYHDARITRCDGVGFEVTDVFPIGIAEAIGRLALSPDGSTVVGLTSTDIIRFTVEP